MSNFANPRGPNSDGSCSCQSGRVIICQSGGVQTRRILFLPIRKGQILPIRRGPISEGSCFCQSKRVIFCQSGGVPNRRGPVCASLEESCFANPEGFHFGGVLFLAIRKGHFLPIWRGPNSEGSSFYQYVRVKFCQSGGVPIRRGPVFANPKGSSFANP